MLNKKLCIKCINKYRSKYPDPDIEYGWCKTWVESDERNWMENIVSCPLHFHPFGARTNEKPVISCPYKLEHIVSKG